MPSIDYKFLLKLKDSFSNYPCFIETGTHVGGTIFAVEPHFDYLYTIEFSEKYYTKTKSTYTRDKIQFIHGDSSIVFTTLLPTIQEKTIFFLDGHWSSGDTGKSEKDCPLIEEVTHIHELFSPSAILIIDDYRLFGKGPSSTQGEDWSDITEEKITDILGSRITDLYFMDSYQCKKDRLIIHICDRDAA